MFISNKAQTWTIEFIFATVIFLSVIAMFYQFLPNLEKSDDNFEKISTQVNSISENLLSKGVPENWNASNLIRPGVIKKGQTISKEKIERFYKLSENNYTLIKKSLGIDCNFIIYFIDNEDKPIKISGKYLTGKQDINFENNKINTSQISADQIAKTQRIVIFEKEPINMVVIGWA
ncbi:MAG: hypothetical protein ACQESF_03050 [Nanobdellota archaeon]